MTPKQKDMLATLTPNYNQRHVQALVQIVLQTPGAYGDDLDTMTAKEIADLLVFVRICVKAFGPEIMEILAKGQWL